MRTLFVSNSRQDQLVIQAPPSEIAAFVAEAKAGGVDVRQSACTCGGNHSQSSVSNKKPEPLGIPRMDFSQAAKAEAKPVANSVKKGLGIPRMVF